MDVIFKLFLIGLIPVIVSAITRYVDKNTKFGKLNFVKKQIIIGFIFGCLSIIGTEFGVKANGVIINVRDAAPICAGLIFGGPAGIIAGIMGGVERYFSVYWGGGTLTRYACSISTIFAGFFAAIIRKLLFDNHHAKWYYGFFSGIFIETFHMLMVFVTKMNDISTAYKIVSSCSVIMITVNSLCIMLAMLVTTIVSKEPIFPKEKPLTISTKIQIGLLISILVAFGFVSTFTYSVLSSLSSSSTEKLLKTTVDDTITEIQTSNFDDAKSEFSKNSFSMAWIINDNTEFNDEFKNTLKSYVDSSNLNSLSVIDMNNDKIIISTNDSLTDTVFSYKDDSKYLGEKKSTSFSAFYFKDAENNTLYCLMRSKNYFLLGIYKDNSFNDHICSVILDIVEKRHIGDSGSLLLLDATKMIENESYRSIKNSLKDTEIVLGALSKTDNDDFKEYYYFAKEYYGYYIVAIEKIYEADININTSLYVTTFMEILVFYSMYVLIYVLIKKIMVAPILRINKNLKKITYGMLDTKVKEVKTQEMKLLSDDINMTVSSLKGYIEKEALKQKEELDFAKEIQSSSLPSTFPAYPNNYEFDIYASMDTAKEVGGDFYDFYQLDPKHLCILIADVSGKGVPAAMFMMQSKTIIKNLMETGLDVGTAFTVANNKLCEGNKAGMFVTAWIGVLNIETGVLEYSNAGHNPPLIKTNGKFEYLKSRPGLVLAGMEDLRYKKFEITLNKGDEIYLYTDGVTEAKNINDELYSEERLINLLNNNLNLEPKERCKNVIEDVNEYVNGYIQSDDITMLSLKYYGDRLVKEIEIESNLESMNTLYDEVGEFLESNLVNMKLINKLNIAIDEIVSNIIHYGYKDDKGKIKVIVIKDDNEVTIKFIDSGIEYNPLLKDDPDVTLDADNREIGGLGIFMVKNMMDSMTYEYENGRNVLVIKKNIN